MCTLLYCHSMKLGVRYLLTVTAANARGSSPPVTISYKPKGALAGKVVSPNSHDLFGLTPLLMALGLLLVVMVAACVAMGYAVVRRRSTRIRKDSRKKILQAEPSSEDTKEDGDVHTIVCVKGKGLANNCYYYYFIILLLYKNVRNEHG